MPASSSTVEEHASPRWQLGPSPKISALVCTYQRHDYVRELITSLEHQELHNDEFEVIVVDDGSSDGTWHLLSSAAAKSDIRLLVLRHQGNRGPAAARNQAASRARAPFLAFTDDDCLPTAAWLRATLEAFDGDVDVVQGRVRAHPEQFESSGPWDHTIWVGRPSPFFETCNVAYRRSLFDEIGGFDDRDRFLTPVGEERGFGEDAELAWRAIRAGGKPAFAHDALVHHRCLPEGFVKWLRRQRHISGFPGLAVRSPLVAKWLRGGLFLTPQSAAFDALVAGVAGALLLRRPWPLAISLPWLGVRLRDSVRKSRGDRSRAPLLFLQYGISDLVTFLSLVEGSLRHGRPVL